MIYLPFDPEYTLLRRFLAIPVRANGRVPERGVKLGKQTRSGHGPGDGVQTCGYIRGVSAGDA